MNIFHSKPKGAAPFILFMIILVALGGISVGIFGHQLRQIGTRLLNLNPLSKEESQNPPSSKETQSQEETKPQEEITSSKLKVTSVKLTTAKHNGDFGGLNGMNEWIQTHGCPGYHVCWYGELMNYELLGQKEVKEFYDSYGGQPAWISKPQCKIEDCVFSCGCWTSATQEQTCKDPFGGDDMYNWTAYTMILYKDRSGAISFWPNADSEVCFTPLKVWCCK